jgi:hypothetical protein
MRVSEIGPALITNSKVQLNAACCNHPWEATDFELQQIRDYLGVNIEKYQAA